MAGSFPRVLGSAMRGSLDQSSLYHVLAPCPTVHGLNSDANSPLQFICHSLGVLQAAMTAARKRKVPLSLICRTQPLASHSAIHHCGDSI